MVNKSGQAFMVAILTAHSQEAILQATALEEVVELSKKKKIVSG